MSYLNHNDKATKNQERLFTAISAGFFLLLIGAIFIITPNLFREIMDFFGDFTVVNIPNTEIVFLGPEFPRLHLNVYEAMGNASIAFAVFQLIILALRFVIPSSWGKRSETAGNMVYWSGAAYLIQLFLIENSQWFVFWSTIIIIVGVSLIVRAVVMAVSQIQR